MTLNYNGYILHGTPREIKTFIDLVNNDNDIVISNKPASEEVLRVYKNIFLKGEKEHE